MKIFATRVLISLALLAGLTIGTQYAVANSGGLQLTDVLEFVGGEGSGRGIRNTNARGVTYDWIRAVDVNGVTKTRMNTDGSWEWYYGAHDMSNPSGPLVVHFAGHGTVEVFPQTAGNGGFVVSPGDDLTPAKDAFNITNAARTQSLFYISRDGRVFGRLNSGVNAQMLTLNSATNTVELGSTNPGLYGISLNPGTGEALTIGRDRQVKVGSAIALNPAGYQVFSSTQGGMTHLNFPGGWAGSNNGGSIVTNAKVNDLYLRSRPGQGIALAGGASTAQMYVAPNGNVGIQTTQPKSALQVATGYAQFSQTTTGQPPVADCNEDAEQGRISFDYANARMYVCAGAARGWDYSTLND